MQPMTSGWLRELTGHAHECIAQVLATATAAQRELLLEAMNALDDIETLVEMPFDISGAVIEADAAGSPAVYAAPIAEVALVA